MKDYVIPLFPSKNQLNNEKIILMSISSAIDEKIICNRIMGYFLGKIYEFALYNSLHHDEIRFRQHLPDEQAHYAVECWDLECKVRKKKTKNG